VKAPVYALAIRLVSALRAGALLVTRRRSGVAHVYCGRVTASGRFAAAGNRALCGVRSRRLTVLPAGVEALGPRKLRLCRRCAPLLPDVPAGSPYAGRLLVAFDDQAAAFAHLTVDDFTVAAAWCTTVEETHQVGRLMQLVLGPTPLQPATEAEHRHRAAEQVLLRRRRHLTTAAMSPEEREAQRLQREAEDAERIRVNEARRRLDRVDRAQDRALRGSCLTPYERGLLAEQASQ
jgi:hypothetical protein